MISVVEISKLIIYCAGLVTVCILQTEQSKFISSLLYGILEKKAIHFAKLLTRRQSTKSDTQSQQNMILSLVVILFSFFFHLLFIVLSYFLTIFMLLLVEMCSSRRRAIINTYILSK